MKLLNNLTKIQVQTEIARISPRKIPKMTHVTPFWADSGPALTRRRHKARDIPQDPPIRMHELRAGAEEHDMAQASAQRQHTARGMHVVYEARHHTRQSPREDHVPTQDILLLLPVLHDGPALHRGGYHVEGQRGLLARSRAQEQVTEEQDTVPVLLGAGGRRHCAPRGPPHGRNAHLPLLPEAHATTRGPARLPQFQGAAEGSRKDT